MTLDVDGWFDFATRAPGPPEKQYTAPNFANGWALHSMEGTVASAERELMNPARQASWCGSLPRAGGLRQHYPIFASCWASGNRQANTTLVGWELEGFAGEPATPEQVATLMLMRADWHTAGRRYLQRADTRTLWEHNEVATWVVPNAGPTACPSGRYAPFYVAIEEDAMTPAELERFERLERIVAANGAAITDPATGEKIITSGQDAILRLDSLGVSLALQQDGQNDAILDLKARYEGHGHAVPEIGSITTGGPQP